MTDCSATGLHTILNHQKLCFFFSSYHYFQPEVMQKTRVSVLIQFTVVGTSCQRNSIQEIVCASGQVKFLLSFIIFSPFILRLWFFKITRKFCDSKTVKKRKESNFTLEICRLVKNFCIRSDYEFVRKMTCFY